MSARPWWRDASIYQVYVRSFADSEGDGIGDLRGISQRMQYIASLGVDAIWLNPCYPSPQKDHGYDVADYLEIDPVYGGLAAFDELVETARAHGIYVLMDIVPNHCSAAHPWFQAALSAAPGSPERDRFIFRAGRGETGELPPNNWKALFGGSVWTRVTEADGTLGEWYLGVFTPDQPDLNWDNTDVVEHFDEVLRFWFDRGAEGFRADAVIFNAKTPGLPDVGQLAEHEHNPHYTWLPEGHRAWRRWRTMVNEYQAKHPERALFLVAEAFTPNRPDLLLQYANPQEFHQAFAFDLMLSPWSAAHYRHIVDGTVRALMSADMLAAWTLNNHDTHRTVTRYGRADAATKEPAPGAIVNDNQPVDFELGSRRARAAALFELALPGCVYLYAGEELGLPEVLDLPDELRQDPVFFNSGGQTKGRDGCRVPLPWTVDAAGSYGFGPHDSTHSWLPQPANWGTYAVDQQEREPASFLNLYRTAGRLRRDIPGFRSDSFAWLDAGSEDVLLFSRGEVIVAFNPSANAVEVPEGVVRAYQVALCSEYEHDDPQIIPANATAWLIPSLR